MEFFDVQTGCAIGALKSAIVEQGQQGWVLLLRDEDDALLPLTCDGEVQVFRERGLAASVARRFGIKRVLVLEECG
ncbi:hypothetical protein [Motiliproteus sediminis]|uniref:hypothetical protein n=1 Tax=Motiliproteus sediminis TaxID=1468178 RepID=UPI001AEFAA31|nr:hypothetical protein [Motiliproteus sediminis]